MVTFSKKTRAFPRVETFEDLFLKFDARIGLHQWEPYLTQLPGWQQARDPQGRTLLMIGFGSTKGRNADLYLRSDVEQTLIARDYSGRNLWHYVFMNRLSLGGPEGATWEAVLKRLNFGVNPVSGHGMITDALLNPLSFYTRHKNKDRRQANDVLPLFTTEDLSSGSERLTSSGRLLKWAGKGRDAWWACPERDEQALFDALTLRLYWPNWHEGATRLEKAVAQTLGPKDQREQLPAPYLAFATVAELMTAPLDRAEHALEAVRAGQLEPFIGGQWDRFVKTMLKGEEGIVDAQQRRGQPQERMETRHWLAAAREVHMQHRLGAGNARAASVRKPRL
jgi:hypothetical protein